MNRPGQCAVWQDGRWGETIDADEIYAGKVTSAQPERSPCCWRWQSGSLLFPVTAWQWPRLSTLFASWPMQQARGVVRSTASPGSGTYARPYECVAAEAEVAYDKLVEMDRINPTLRYRCGDCIGPTT